MKLKKAVALILCFALLACLCGCGKSNAPASKRYVAVIVKSVSSDFFRNMKNGVDTAATEYNVKVTFEGPESEEDYESQNRMIENAVNNGADAIVLSAIDYEKSNLAIENAVRKGVKVITVDSGVSSNLVSLFIGTDSAEAGHAAGRAVLDIFTGISSEKICIGLITYTEDTDNGKRRVEGFKQEIAADKKAEIVTEKVAPSTVEGAKAAALSVIEEYPQVNVLVGFNEWMTLGVGEAIRNTGSAQKIKGIGFDTNVTSVGMLETGEMSVLIAQNPFAMGYLGVKSADDILSGETYAENPIYTAVTAVTRENMFDEDIQKILFRFK